jgi:O-acetyl-ADP-ribose deacetylase (regulator of RNase III)
MPIVYKTGNILDDDADWIVNPVNTVGVMGAGLAKQFKDKYGSHYFNHYKTRCNNGQLATGRVNYYMREDWLTTNKHIPNDNAHIINFPTKKHWRDNSKVEYIECGLNDLAASPIYLKIGKTSAKSIAFPRLGCGLGGLDWETQVRPLMEEFAARLPEIEVRVYV